MSSTRPHFRLVLIPSEAMVSWDLDSYPVERGNPQSGFFVADKPVTRVRYDTKRYHVCSEDVGYNGPGFAAFDLDTAEVVEVRFRTEYDQDQHRKGSV